MIEADSQFAWRRSSRCESGACVEVAPTVAGVAMRDAKVADGPVLTFGRQEWAAFLAGIRAHDFEVE